MLVYPSVYMHALGQSPDLNYIIRSLVWAARPNRLVGIALNPYGRLAVALSLDRTGGRLSNSYWEESVQGIRAWRKVGQVMTQIYAQNVRKLPYRIWQY